MHTHTNASYSADGHQVSSKRTHRLASVNRCVVKLQPERAERNRGRQHHFVVSGPRRTKASAGDKSPGQNGTDTEK